MVLSYILDMSMEARNAAAREYLKNLPADDPPPTPLTEDDVNSIVANCRN